MRKKSKISYLLFREKISLPLFAYYFDIFHFSTARGNPSRPLYLYLTVCGDNFVRLFHLFDTVIVITFRLENVCEIGKYLSPAPLLNSANKGDEGSYDVFNDEKYGGLLKLENGALRQGLLKRLKEVQDMCEMLGTLVT